MPITWGLPNERASSIHQHDKKEHPAQSADDFIGGQFEDRHDFQML
jgi:hypothetical protein